MESSETTAHRFLNLLQGTNDFWHRTSVSSLKAIIESGFIFPNNGAFPFSYPQSKNSLARKIESVSLFDFDTKSKVEILEQSWKWQQFMHDKGEATVLIRLSRKILLQNIVFPWSAYDLVPLELTWIPNVEVCHKGRIPVEAFQELYIFRRKGFDFFRLSYDENVLLQVEKIEKKWLDETRLEAERILSKDNLSMADYFSNPILYSMLFKED